jgi:hypothetical protein
MNLMWRLRAKEMLRMTHPMEWIVMMIKHYRRNKVGGSNHEFTFRLAELERPLKYLSGGAELDIRASSSE